MLTSNWINEVKQLIYQFIYQIRSFKSRYINDDLIESFLLKTVLTKLLKHITYRYISFLQRLWSPNLVTRVDRRHHPKYGKLRTRKTRNDDTFHAVAIIKLHDFEKTYISLLTSSLIIKFLRQEIWRYQFSLDQCIGY